jgi:hypothetical protein
MVRHIEQHQWAGIVSVLCLTLAGCSGTPQNVMLDTPSGPVTLNAPPPPSGGLAEPPPNLMPAQPRPPAAGPVNLDGTYSGSMKVLVTNGNQCQSSTPVHDFRSATNRLTAPPGTQRQLVMQAEAWTSGRGSSQTKPLRLGIFTLGSVAAFITALPAMTPF